MSFFPFRGGAAGLGLSSYEADAEGHSADDILGRSSIASRCREGPPPCGSGFLAAQCLREFLDDLGGKKGRH
jgi:hypothetical protein